MYWSAWRICSLSIQDLVGSLFWELQMLPGLTTPGEAFLPMGQGLEGIVGPVFAVKSAVVVSKDIDRIS